MTYLLGILILGAMLAMTALWYIATVRQSNRLFAAEGAGPGRVAPRPVGRLAL